MAKRAATPRLVSIGGHATACFGIRQCPKTVNESPCAQGDSRTALEERPPRQLPVYLARDRVRLLRMRGVRFRLVGAGYPAVDHRVQLQDRARRRVHPAEWPGSRGGA